MSWGQMYHDGMIRKMGLDRRVRHFRRFIWHVEDELGRIGFRWLFGILSLTLAAGLWVGMNYLESFWR